MSKMYVTCELIVTVLVLVFVYLFLKFFKYQTKHYKFFAKQNIKYLPPTFPNGSDYEQDDLINNERKKYVEYQKFYGRFDGPIPVLTIGERELIDKVMFTDFNKFPNRRDMRVGDDIFDNTLFTLEGNDWKRVRNIVKIGFTHSNLKMMMSLLQDCCSDLTMKINEEVKDEKIFHCQKYFSLFVLRTIARCAFGVTIQDEDPFIKKSNELFNNDWKTYFIVSYPKVMKTFKLPLLNGNTMKFYNRVMSEVVEERKKLEENKCNDFLQRMLEHECKPEDKNNNSEGLSHTEMLSQCVSFFLAGYEATTTLLSHIIYRLAKNEDCQEKVFEEIERFVPKDKSENECERNEVLYGCLGKMKYTEAVVKECLRMCPPMVRLERRASEDYTFPNGVEVKEGFLISIPIFAIHYDPEYYEEPETFNPDRFYFGDRNEFKNIFFPFGAGTRECVGKNFVMMQVKMCLLSLVMNYRILPSPNTPEHLRILDMRNVCKVEDVEVILRRRTQV